MGESCAESEGWGRSYIGLNGEAEVAMVRTVGEIVRRFGRLVRGSSVGFDSCGVEAAPFRTVGVEVTALTVECRKLRRFGI